MSNKKDQFDHSQTEINQEAAVIAENLGTPETEVEALLATGLPGVQAELENTAEDMSEEDLNLANELASGDEININTIRERTSHMGRERKGRLGLFLTLSLLFVFLVSCAQPIDANDNAPGVNPGTEVVAAEVTGTPADETPGLVTEIAPTPTTIPFSELEIDYGRYSGDEVVVDPYIERAWALINSFVIERDLAAPGAIEIIDVSAENIIVEVLPQGRTDDYPEGISFTISFVDGHVGETLSVSMDGANAVAGGTAVELAIGANNLPVALDASGDVVAYVDKETGQWTAGSIELAAEVVEVPYFEMSEAERLTESRAFVEAASQYDGEVSFTWQFFEERGDHYPLYWSPTHDQWKTTEDADPRGVPEADLDRQGETLPARVIEGFENPDGSLVMVRDGVETVFPAQIFVPGLGEISMRDLMAMGQDRLGAEVIEQALTSLDVDANQQMHRRTEVQTQFSIFMPGFDIGDSEIYAYPIGSGGGPNTDLLEPGLIVAETPGNQFVIPIFSPETGDFMFFLNVQQGTLAATLQFNYSPTGEMSHEITRTNERFDGGFGILIENRDPELSHYEGGNDAMMTDDEPGIGMVTDIEAILNAGTEQEILDIMNDHGLFVSIPFRVMSPEN